MAVISITNHSVTLDPDKCKGCTNCIKRCPTAAIRVRHGKAQIINERCIDCGECIRRCPYHAKKAVYDSLDQLANFKYNVALPAPALYGQFSNISDINLVLTGLLDLGFDSVYEVAKGAELVSSLSHQLLLQGQFKHPTISSACPAIARLIQVRFPNLCDQVLPITSPMQTAARLAKEEAILKTGLSRSQIGVFFISPCPAKVTEVRQPLGIKQSWLDGALAINDIYPLLLEKLGAIVQPLSLATSGISGIRWASSGGEASALLPERYLAADGMENVMAVLEEIEGDRLGELDFIELNACPGGCVGGVLTVENPYVAKARIQALRRNFTTSVIAPPNKQLASRMLWNAPFVGTGVMRLSHDLGEALSMMAEIERVYHALPELDCGSCGAPSCRTMAEDIVKGYSTLYDCTFILRERAEALHLDNDDYLTIRKTTEEDSK